MEYKPVIVKKEIDDEHYYLVDGEYYPSVTKILGEAMPTPPALRQWIGDVGNEKAEQKLNRAAERGSAIHHACERLLVGLEIKLLEEFPKREDRKAVVSFCNWVNEFHPAIKNIEFTVASKLKFAGTLDIYCYMDTGNWIIDIKTSGSIHDSHKLQLAAYRQAFQEMTGIYANIGILHLNPRTVKGWTFHTDLKIEGKPVETEDFMTVYSMYKMLNGGVIPEPPMIDTYPEILSLYDAKN